MACSPGPEVQQPFHLISSDPADIAGMQKAEKNPHLVMLSDWDHLTAAQYQKVQEDSRVNILWVNNSSPYRISTNIHEAARIVY